MSEKRHVIEALHAMADLKIGKNMVTEFIRVVTPEMSSSARNIDTPDPKVSVTFDIQSDPIGTVGVDGLQVTDMLKYVLELYRSLHKRFPCDENESTIDHIEQAIMWQDERTKDRESRKVEGKNEA